MPTYDFVENIHQLRTLRGAELTEELPIVVICKCGQARDEFSSRRRQFDPLESLIAAGGRAAREFFLAQARDQLRNGSS